MLFSWSLHRESKRDEQSPDELFHVGSFEFLGDKRSDFLTRPKSRRVVWRATLEHFDKFFTLFDCKRRNFPWLFDAIFGPDSALVKSDEPTMNGPSIF